MSKLLRDEDTFHEALPLCLKGTISALITIYIIHGHWEKWRHLWLVNDYGIMGRIRREEGPQKMLCLCFSTFSDCLEVVLCSLLAVYQLQWGLMCLSARCT